MKSENGEIVKQYIEDILNTGNDKNLSDFISPHYTELFNDKRYRLGIEGMRKKISNIRERYPDLKLSIDLQTIEGDWVITSYMMKGTQCGSWMGLIPTKKTIELWGVNIDKIVNGKIMEHTSSTHLLDPLIGIHKHPLSSNENSMKIFSPSDNNHVAAGC